MRCENAKLVANDEIFEQAAAQETVDREKPHVPEFEARNITFNVSQIQSEGAQEPSRPRHAHALDPCWGYQQKKIPEGGTGRPEKERGGGRNEAASFREKRS